MLDFFESMKEVTPEWYDSHLDKGVMLYDFEDEHIGWLYRPCEGSKQTGYIVYIYGIGVIEAAWEGSDDALRIEGKVYYALPGGFFTEDERNEKLQDIAKEDTVYGYKYRITNYNPVDSTISYYSYNWSLDSSKHPSLGLNVTSQGSSYGIRKIINRVPDYTGRKGCAPTALATVIAYFDNEWHESLSSHDGVMDFSWNYAVTTDSNELIDELAIYLNTDSSGGTNIFTIPMDWEDYLDDHNHGTYEVLMAAFSNDSIWWPEVNTSDYQTLISRGNPVLISVLDYEGQGGHAVTGVGYVNAYPNVQGAIVHDNWSSTPREIFIDYKVLRDYYYMYNVS